MTPTLVVRGFLILMLLCTSLAGCSKKKEEPKEKAKSHKVEKAKPSPKAAKPKKSQRYAALTPDLPKTKLSEIPTVAELEEEAAKRIKPENLESELDRLEAEIVGFEN
jgi:hypothetical protein